MNDNLSFFCFLWFFCSFFGEVYFQFSWCAFSIQYLEYYTSESRLTVFKTESANKFKQNWPDFWNIKMKKKSWKGKQKEYKHNFIDIWNIRMRNRERERIWKPFRMFACILEKTNRSQKWTNKWTNGLSVGQFVYRLS